MKLLVVSFYYPPDLSAGSFRIGALTRALSEAAPGAEIEVVTTLPNRYRSYSADASVLEREGNITVHRIPLPPHRSDVYGQSRAFAAFARRALKLTRGRDYDICVATSSRLLSASLGAVIARRGSMPLYLDIRDIFVDTLKDVSLGPLPPMSRALFAQIERWTIGQARRVNLVSAGFADYFRVRYPTKELSFHTNGVDDEFIAAATVSSQNDSAVAKSSNRRTIVYAGNIGEGQGLHAILPLLARALGSQVHFRVIGDGGRKAQLERALAALNVHSVSIEPPMSRESLITAYHEADVLFLHLNDYDAFRRVLPSKLFEYGAMGKPILAGMSGYAADFMRAELGGDGLFHPCDVSGAVEAFGRLAEATSDRQDFIRRFSRRTISAAMAADILQLAAGS